MMRILLTVAALWLQAGPALAAPDLAALGQSAGYAIGPDGAVENDCGEVVTATMTQIDLGGAASQSYLLLIPGGPNSLTCYGDVPGVMFLAIEDAAGLRIVFSGRGYIMVLPTSQGGVQDFALGGPGFSFPLFRWDGKAFELAGPISDQEVAAFGAIPIYPQ